MTMLISIYRFALVIISAFLTGLSISNLVYWIKAEPSTYRRKLIAVNAVVTFTMAFQMIYWWLLAPFK